MKMKFEIRDLKKLLHSIKNNNIDEINIQSNKFALTINKINKLKVVQQNQSTNKKITINKKSKKNENFNNQQIKKNTSSNSETYFTIVSPMVGTFYCSPAPNEPAFVELYDTVQKQQTVCIIEAMKLMNEIESEIHGEIVEILVQDGDIIDCGQALMKVRPLKE